MAGWGLCGLLGAALALGGRNVSRLTLAAACGFAGLAYGALLNFSLMATYGGDLSLEHFLVLESRAVPFDAAHAIGNVAFALVAGPAMIRMLARFRGRFEWRARPRTPAVAGRCCSPVASCATPCRPPPSAAGAGRAASWLESVQNSDGGFGDSPGDASSTSTTAWVMLGLEASGRNPLDVSRGGNSAVDYMRSEGRRPEQQRRLRADDPRRRGRRARPPLLRRPRPGLGPAQAAPRRRLMGRPGTVLEGLAGKHRVRDRRPAGGRRHRRPRKVAVVAGRSPERRRRLGRRTGLAQQRRRDRRRDAGDPELEGGAGRPRLPAQSPARQRRLRPRRRRVRTPSRRPGPRRA